MLDKLPPQARRIHTQYLKLLREKKMKVKHKIRSLAQHEHLNNQGEYKGSLLHKYLTKLHRLEYKLHKHRFKRSGVGEHSTKRNRYAVAEERAERIAEEKRELRREINENIHIGNERGKEFSRQKLLDRENKRREKARGVHYNSINDKKRFLEAMSREAEEERSDKHHDDLLMARRRKSKIYD